MGITMFTHILTCVAVILRLYARIWIVKRVGPDDWVIVLALVRLTLLDDSRKGFLMRYR